MPVVLYITRSGHPAQLSNCYHATGSLELTSSSQLFPSTTRTEVDSAFCPQCLGFHDAASAARLVYCPNTSCRSCPMCYSRCSLLEEEGTIHYACGACNYTSRNSLFVRKAGQNATLTKDQILSEMGALVEKQQSSTLRRVQYSATEKAAELYVKQKSMPGSTAHDAEKDAPERQSLSNYSCLTFDKSLDGLPTSMLQSQLDYDTPVTSSESLLPLQVILRLRKARRCRNELSKGRPGILVKPKLSPLEGDSSIRTGHGQWWKKDSSAVHSVPRFEVLGIKDGSARRSFLVRITNPDINEVLIRLSSSSEQDTPCRTVKGVELSKHDSRQIVNISYKTVPPKSDLISEVSSLSPWDDSLVTIGSRALIVPQTVDEWLASPPPASEGFVTLGRKNSTAWYEFTAPVSRECCLGGIRTACCVLQLNSKSGPWSTGVDSVSPNDSWVSFHLVLAWNLS